MTKIVLPKAAIDYNDLTPFVILGLWSTCWISPIETQIIKLKFKKNLTPI